MAEFSQCQYPGCTRPLGQDSKDQQYAHCHDHRLCVLCGTPVSGIESKYAQMEQTDVIHSQCKILQRKQMQQQTPDCMITQQRLDYLNMARLLIETNDSVSPDTNALEARNLTTRWLVDLTIEQKFLFLRRIEAIYAECNAVLSKDAAKIQALLKDKQAIEFKKAAEKAVRTENHNTPLTEAKTTRVKLSKREKAIRTMMAATGMSKEDVEKILPPE